MIDVRPPIALAPEDLNCLRTPAPLEGRVINAYLRLLERRNTYWTTAPDLLALDTAFWADWKRGGLPAIRLRLQGTDIWGKELLLLPLHHPEVQPQGHWSLAVVRLRQRRLEAYDPLGLPRMEELRGLLAFLGQWAHREGLHFQENEWTIADTPPGCPRQHDQVSCGVYVCAFAERVALESRLLGTRIDPNTARGSVLRRLVRGQIDTEDFSGLNLDGTPQFCELPLGPASTPQEVIDLCAEEQMDWIGYAAPDPVLEALNAALDRPSPASTPSLFPPLRRTPRPDTGSGDGADSQGPGIPGAGSPELRMEYSDVSDEEGPTPTLAPGGRLSEGTPPLTSETPAEAEEPTTGDPPTDPHPGMPEATKTNGAQPTSNDTELLTARSKAASTQTRTGSPKRPLSSTAAPSRGSDRRRHHPRQGRAGDQPSRPRDRQDPRRPSGAAREPRGEDRPPTRTFRLHGRPQGAVWTWTGRAVTRPTRRDAATQTDPDRRPRPRHRRRTTTRARRPVYQPATHVDAATQTVDNGGRPRVRREDVSRRRPRAPAASACGPPTARRSERARTPRPDLREVLRRRRNADASTSALSGDVRLSDGTTLPDPEQLNVPPRLLRRLAAETVDMTRLQRRNTRWRIQTSTGAFIRFRPHQLLGLLEASERYPAK